MAREQETGLKRFVFPVLIIVVGVTWLMNVMNIIPGVNWIWTGGLAVAGVLVIVLGGLNKLTVLLGPWLLVASLCSVLRQTGTLAIDREVPILTIVLGVFLIIGELSKLPWPEYLTDDELDENK